MFHITDLLKLKFADQRHFLELGLPYPLSLENSRTTGKAIPKQYTLSSDEFALIPEDPARPPS